MTPNEEFQLLYMNDTLRVAADNVFSIIKHRGSSPGTINIIKHGRNETNIGKYTAIVDDMYTLEDVDTHPFKVKINFPENGFFEFHEDNAALLEHNKEWMKERNVFAKVEIAYKEFGKLSATYYFADDKHAMMFALASDKVS